MAKKKTKKWSRPGVEPEEAAPSLAIRVARILPRLGKKLLIPLVLAVAYFMLPSFLGIQEPVEALQAEVKDFDPCEEKSACIVAYVAPWCSQCHAATELINHLIDYTDGTEVGVRIVVGGDEMSRLSEMAESYDSYVFFDPYNEYKNEARVGGVPQFISWDASGHEIERVVGRPNLPVNDSGAEMFLGFLKVDKLM